MKPLEKTVNYFGSQKKMAIALGVTQPAIFKLLHGKTRLSAERAIQIESLTDSEISREELRPDIFIK